LERGLLVAKSGWHDAKRKNLQPTFLWGIKEEDGGGGSFTKKTGRDWCPFLGVSGMLKNKKLVLNRGGFDEGKALRTLSNATKGKRD